MDLMGWFQNLMNPQTPEQREKLLETQAKRVELLAESEERQAAFRNRILDANKRRKAVRPKSRLLLVVVGVVFVILLVLVTRTC